jgi:hypothetical protein
MDDEAIAQKPVLGLFGTRFKLRWDDVVSWKVKDAVLLYQATGKERLVDHGLYLFHKSGLHVISRPARDKQFPLIVDGVRQRLPGKENFPVEFDPLEFMNRMSLAKLAHDRRDLHENPSED